LRMGCALTREPTGWQERLIGPASQTNAIGCLQQRFDGFIGAAWKGVNSR
jgi:hypothetical protein